jgi:hypothetical protein
MYCLPSTPGSFALFSESKLHPNPFYFSQLFLFFIVASVNKASCLKVCPWHEQLRSLNKVCHKYFKSFLIKIAALYKDDPLWSFGIT